MKLTQPLHNLARLFVVTAFLAACVSIPSAYRGTYLDQEHNVELVLSMAKGTLEFKDEGRILQAGTADYSFKGFTKAIKKGRPGIFARPNAADSDELDVFWVKPNYDTLQESNGLIWFEAEIFYTRLDKDLRAKVQTLKAVHALGGTVMLDTPTESVQVGWPAGPTEYALQRISDKAKHPKVDE